MKQIGLFHGPHLDRRALTDRLPVKGNGSGAGVAISSGSESRASVHTERVTGREPGSSERSHNSAKRLNRADWNVSRARWLTSAQAASALHRERRAQALETRGKQLAKERLKVWARDGYAARSDRGKALDIPLAHSPWHTSRANGKRNLFERVRECGAPGHEIVVTCKGCHAQTFIPLGCGSRWFCERCRVDTARRYRVDFLRKRTGLVMLANQAGWRTKNRQTGFEKRKLLEGRTDDRFGERMLTLTVPHVGTVEERVEILQHTWDLFWRTLRDHLRPKLAKMLSGIRIDNCERGMPVVYNRKSKERESPDEVTAWDLVHYLKVLEWTPGEDPGDDHGHPHLHVWMFSPIIPWQIVRGLWSEAYRKVSGNATHAQLLITHIEACGPGVEAELIKYLTKEWEQSDSGVRRALPEIFARLYAELDQKRVRQTSSGLSHWAVAKAKLCRECGHERTRESWCHVAITHPLAELANAPSKERPVFVEPAVRVTPASREEELKLAHDAQKDAEWADSFEVRILRARLAGKLTAEETPLELETERDHVGERSCLPPGWRKSPAMDRIRPSDFGVFSRHRKRGKNPV